MWRSQPSSARKYFPSKCGFYELSLREEDSFRRGKIKWHGIMFTLILGISDTVVK